MKFRTKYNFDNSFISTGCTILSIKNLTTKKVEKLKGFENTYKVEYDENGKRHLVISGQRDLYNYIQSFKEDVDIYKILSRYFNGDISILDKNKGFYADITKIPKNFNDFHNKIAEGQEIFKGLPTDFKSKFGNSINEFMNSIYENDFEAKFNAYIVEKKSKKSIVNDVNSVNKVVNVEKEASNE